VIRRLAVVGLLVGLPLAATACGGSGDGEPDPMSDAEVEQVLTDAQHLVDDIDADLAGDQDAVTGG
jgi:hypothetical protein